MGSLRLAWTTTAFWGVLALERRGQAHLPFQRLIQGGLLERCVRVPVSVANYAVHAPFDRLRMLKVSADTPDRGTWRTILRRELKFLAPITDIMLHNQYITVL
jgi:hypothetical protein